jgi:integrase
MSALPQFAGELTIADLVDHYMAAYIGRDPTRTTRLGWWVARIGQLRLDDVTDDHVHVALEELASTPPRYFAGKDADGRSIYKVKRAPRSPATVNRYAASLGAVFTWAIRKRITPKRWVHPCRGLERRQERNERVRFLSTDERERLLQACRESKYRRLHALVLMALTTGARRGELEGLRWCDVDLQRQVAHVGRSKNGDPKTLPLTAAVVEQLKAFQSASGHHVFSSDAKGEGKAGKPFNFEQRWQEALRAARLRGVVFHTLRHTCASYLAQSGASLAEIGDLLGHRDLAMTRRYAHLDVSHRARLVNRVLGDLR